MISENRENNDPLEESESEVPADNLVKLFVGQVTILDFFFRNLFCNFYLKRFQRKLMKMSSSLCFQSLVLWPNLG